MEPQNNERIQKIEQFLLDPEKVIFESIEELGQALSVFSESFAGVDVAALEQLKGVDGYNPQRGVDYFTDDDLEALEQFILQRLPVAGVDYSSREETEALVKKYVGKIPSIKGDRGAKGTAGKDGKNGSPDTGKEILEKLRNIKRGQGLKMTDIEGLPRQIKNIARNSDDIEELKRLADEHYIVTTGSSDGGGIAVDTVLTDEQVQDIIGAIIVPEAGSNITVNYDDAGNQIVIGNTDPNCFTENVVGHGFAVGDLLRRTPAGDVRSDATIVGTADVHKIVKEVIDVDNYVWTASTTYLPNTFGYAQGDNLYLAVGGGLTNIAPDPTINVLNNVGYVENGQIILHASTPGFFGNAPVANSSSAREINQVAHGLTLGQFVRIDSTGEYVPAQADTIPNAEVVGAVVSIIDVDNFAIAQSGYYDIWSGLTVGDPYFLSRSVAGGITPNVSTTLGEVNRPVLIPETATGAWIVPYVGDVVTDPDLDVTASAMSFDDGNIMAFDDGTEMIFDN